jgi:hypothetical protein
VVAAFPAAWGLLRADFSAQQLRTISSFRAPCGVGVDLRRLLGFISATRRTLGGAVSPLTLHLDRWCSTFEGDEDSRFLVEGCAYGFTWDHTAPPSFYEVPNIVAPEHAAKVDAAVEKMVRNGEVARTSRSAVAGIAPLLVVDRGNSGFAKIRLVHDLSSPEGASVNDFQVVPKRRFATVSDAMCLLRPRALHCKVDISDAYRALPLAPAFWRLHVFQWRGQVYSDLRLPFGSAGAPACFDRFTQAFTRMVKAHEFAAVGYMDDFWLTP